MSYSIVGHMATWSNEAHEFQDAASRNCEENSPLRFLTAVYDALPPSILIVYHIIFFAYSYTFRRLTFIITYTFLHIKQACLYTFLHIYHASHYTFLHQNHEYSHTFLHIILMQRYTFQHINMTNKLFFLSFIKLI